MSNANFSTPFLWSLLGLFKLRFIYYSPFVTGHILFFFRLGVTHLHDSFHSFVFQLRHAWIPPWISSHSPSSHILSHIISPVPKLLSCRLYYSPSDTHHLPKETLLNSYIPWHHPFLRLHIWLHAHNSNYVSYFPDIYVEEKRWQGTALPNSRVTLTPSCCHMLLFKFNHTAIIDSLNLSY